MKNLEEIIRLGDYALVDRHSSYQTYVAAFAPEYDEQGNIESWGNGTYFNGVADALMYILMRICPNTVISSAVCLCADNGRVELAEALAAMRFDMA